MTILHNKQIKELKKFLAYFRPRSKALTRRRLRKLIKLESRINCDLVNLYDGLHPKHLFFTRHEWLLQFVDEGDIVLDIASGTGCCAYNLSKKCRKVIAIDFQRPLERFIDAPNLEFYQGDILKIVPEIKENYTFAVALHILEHLDAPVEFLKRVKADRIAVIVPHEENWFVSVKKDLGLNWRGDSSHKRLYNQALLRSHLNGAGYKDIDVLEFDGDNGIRAVANRRI
jgi:SAM-dependent methyltransferase